MAGLAQNASQTHSQELGKMHKLWPACCVASILNKGKYANMKTYTNKKLSYQVDSMAR